MASVANGRRDYHGLTTLLQIKDISHTPDVPGNFKE